MFWAMPLPLPP